MCFSSGSKLRPCIYLVSLAGAFIFWTLEAVMENGFITEHFSLAVFFPADPGVLWFRILAGVCIVAFAINYQERFGYIKDLEQQLDTLRGEKNESKRTYISLCSRCQGKEQHQIFQDLEKANGQMPVVNHRVGEKVTV